MMEETQRIIIDDDDASLFGSRTLHARSTRVVRPHPTSDSSSSGRGGTGKRVANMNSVSNALLAAAILAADDATTMEQDALELFPDNEASQKTAEGGETPQPPARSTGQQAHDDDLRPADGSVPLRSSGPTAGATGSTGDSKALFADEEEDDGNAFTESYNEKEKDRASPTRSPTLLHEGDGFSGGVRGTVQDLHGGTTTTATTTTHSSSAEPRLSLHQPPMLLGEVVDGVIADCLGDNEKDRDSEKHPEKLGTGAKRKQTKRDADTRDGDGTRNPHAVVSVLTTANPDHNSYSTQDTLFALTGDGSDGGTPRLIIPPLPLPPANHAAAGSSHFQQHSSSPVDDSLEADVTLSALAVDATVTTQYAQTLMVQDLSLRTDLSTTTNTPWAAGVALGESAERTRESPPQPADVAPEPRDVTAASESSVTQGKNTPIQQDTASNHPMKKAKDITATKTPALSASSVLSRGERGVGGERAAPQPKVAEEEDEDAPLLALQPAAPQVPRRKESHKESERTESSPSQLTRGVGAGGRHKGRAVKNVSPPPAAETANKKGSAQTGMTPRPPLATRAQLTVGTRVEAKWGRLWFPATVSEDESSGYVQIRWDEDGSLLHMRVREVRLPERATAGSGGKELGTSQDSKRLGKKTTRSRSLTVEKEEGGDAPRATRPRVSPAPSEATAAPPATSPRTSQRGAPLQATTEEDPGAAVEMNVGHSLSPSMPSVQQVDTRASSQVSAMAAVVGGTGATPMTGTQLVELMKAEDAMEEAHEKGHELHRLSARAVISTTTAAVTSVPDAVRQRTASEHWSSAAAEGRRKAPLLSGAKTTGGHATHEERQAVPSVDVPAPQYAAGTAASSVTPTAVPITPTQAVDAIPSVSPSVSPAAIHPLPHRGHSRARMAAHDRRHSKDLREEEEQEEGEGVDGMVLPRAAENHSMTAALPPVGVGEDYYFRLPSPMHGGGHGVIAPTVALGQVVAVHDEGNDPAVNAVPYHHRDASSLPLPVVTLQLYEVRHVWMRQNPYTGEVEQQTTVYLGPRHATVGADALLFNTPVYVVHASALRHVYVLEEDGPDADLPPRRPPSPVTQPDDVFNPHTASTPLHPRAVQPLPSPSTTANAMAVTSEAAPVSGEGGAVVGGGRGASYYGNTDPLPPARRPPMLAGLARSRVTPTAMGDAGTVGGPSSLPSASSSVLESVQLGPHVIRTGTAISFRDAFLCNGGVDLSQGESGRALGNANNHATDDEEHTLLPAPPKARLGKVEMLRRVGGATVLVVHTDTPNSVFGGSKMCTITPDMIVGVLPNECDKRVENGGG